MRLRLIVIILCFYIPVIGQVDSIKFQVEKYYNTELSDSLRAMYEAKLEHMNKYIAQDSLNAKAYLQRGIYYTCLGLHPESITDYSKCLELDSTESIAYYNRGLAKGRFLYSLDACKDLKSAFDLGVEDALDVLVVHCRRYHKILGLKD